MLRALSWAAMVAAWLLATGCSPLLTSISEDDLIRAGRDHLIADIDVPEVEGVEGCGAQALAAVLSYLDPAFASQAMAAELPWHDVGATPVDLLLEARRRGYAASVHSGTFDALAEHVQCKVPVLVMLDSGLEVRTLFTRYPTPEVMHWAVVSGVARDGSRVLLAAEKARHHPVSRRDFERRWNASDRCLIHVARLAETVVTARPAPTTGSGPTPQSLGRSRP